MAESFRGKEYTIYFSNGGMEGFLQGLIQLSEELPASNDLQKTTDILRTVLNAPYSCRTFDLFGTDDTPSIKFSDINRIQFARLTALFCLELTKPESELEATGLFWDLESRLSFLARLMNLYSLIENLLQEKSIKIPALNILLSENEMIAVEKLRLQAIYEQKKHLLCNSERLVTVRKIIELSERDTISTNLLQLSAIYWEYAKLIDDTLTKEQKISFWKRLLEIETQIGEIEDIELVKEFLEAIEKE